MFVLGYLLLLVVYAALVIPGIGSAASVVVILAFGAYYAATDGILAALASSLLPPDVRATGLSLVMTATSLARLLASVLFGAIWVLLGVHVAVAVFAVGIVLAAVFATVVLTRYGGADGRCLTCPALARPRVRVDPGRLPGQRRPSTSASRTRVAHCSAPPSGVRVATGATLDASAAGAALPQRDPRQDVRQARGRIARAPERDAHDREPEVRSGRLRSTGAGSA